MRVRQEQNKSYKEVCSSVLQRCRFLLKDVRPFHTKKDNLNILHRNPRLKNFARKIIKRRSTSPRILVVRPEDILNVSIQSQEAILNNEQNESTEISEPTLEMDKDALIDRIQQQQLREQAAIEQDEINENEEEEETEDVDDEAKDEDSKR